jgi:oligoribonuclease NrnB/cAMP/cGMP phosphodiesterase (DHH superfamily)
MQNNKKVHVFIHADLDGAACYMTLCWFSWFDPTYIVTNHESLRTNVSKWMLKNKIQDYDEIYFLGLDPCEISDIIDYNNVMIMNHHQESSRCRDFFKKANVMTFEYGSSVLGVYRFFKDKYSDRKISAQQRKFIALVDDYISYRLLEKDLSVGLNIIYWNYQGNKVEKLSKDFYFGFNSFNEEQLKIVDFYKSKIRKIIQASDFYVGDVKIQGVFRKVIATFAEVCINEVASELTGMGYEMAIIVNSNTRKVSFRKNHHSNLDLSKVAKTLTDGGGYKNTAGGIITEKFMSFTKLLDKKEITL